jgi:hypothetical protein
MNRERTAPTGFGYSSGQQLPTFVKPVREDRGRNYESYVERHPSYAMIGASRVTAGPGQSLFGSDFRHQHFVVVTIKRASMSRSEGNADYYHADDEIVEVALSEAQWATFVASPNVGDGVPATLEYLGRIEPEERGLVPRIAPLDDRRVQFRTEVDERLQAAIKGLDEAIAVAPTKKMREQLERVRQQLTDGLPWVAKQFDEHAEQTIEKAKIEVGAYITSAIHRAGIAALGGAQSPILLTTGEGEDER